MFALLASALPACRLDAKTEGNVGKPCGESNIPKTFDCHAGQGSGKQAPPNNVMAVVDDLNKFKNGKLAIADLPKSWSEDADLLDGPLSVKDYLEMSLNYEASDRARYDPYTTEDVYGKDAGQFIVDDGQGSPWLVQNTDGKWGVQRAGFSEQQAQAYLKPFGEDAEVLLSSAASSPGAMAKAIARAKQRVREWATRKDPTGSAMHKAYQRSLEIEQAADNPDLRIYARYADPDRYDSVLPRDRTDAWQQPKVQGKAPGQPCGNSWISAKYKCPPDKIKTAQSRLKNPDNKTVKARYTQRVRKAKGLSMGPRSQQLEDRIAKKIAEKKVIPFKGKSLSVVRAKNSRTEEPNAGGRHLSVVRSEPEKLVRSIRATDEKLAALKDVVTRMKNDRIAGEIAKKKAALAENDVQIKPVTAIRAALATQKAIKSKNPDDAYKAANLLRSSVGLKSKEPSALTQKLITESKQRIAEEKLAEAQKNLSRAPRTISDDDYQNLANAVKVAQQVANGVKSDRAKTATQSERAADTKKMSDRGAMVSGRGAPTRVQDVTGRWLSIDSVDRQDTGMGVRFAGRNTGILVDADSRSEAISKARKKKKRGGDEVEEVWTLTPAQKAKSDKGEWVTTVGKDERHLASEGRRGQGPKPKNYDSVLDGDREDRKQVANSAGKVPGKRCKGGWISANYQCSDHTTSRKSAETNPDSNKFGKEFRKLTPAGKKAAEELAAKARAQRGLKPKTEKAIASKKKAVLARNTEAEFKAEIEKRKKSPMAAKAINTGAKSRIKGALLKLSELNESDRASLPTEKQGPILPLPPKIDQSGGAKARISRLMESLKNVDKPLENDFEAELQRRRREKLGGS